jgi:hypothetical protein
MPVAKVMMTIRVPRDAPPKIEDVRARYHLAPDDLDATFGVIAVDPSDGTYTVLVEEHALSKLCSDANWEVAGPFANPRIDPAR